FKHVLASGSGGSHRFVPPAAGVYYWCVMATGGTATPTAKFALVEDVPPVLTSPLPREIVTAPPGRAVPFSWTPVAGVRSYHFELAADAAFEDLRASEIVDTPKLWLRHELPEAVYFWRVRSNDKERGVSPYSPAASFRLVTRPLLEAPELLDAELEVR
ncbi:MAG: hypothetical protein HYZ27_00115, partial [Deltaproteobacteria bacterium]|nr:hypothetical protein [Deltaproteobacteria bacterium]